MVRVRVRPRVRKIGKEKKEEQRFIVTITGRFGQQELSLHPKYIETFLHICQKDIDINGKLVPYKGSFTMC